jgi:hypothetical protein
MKTSLTPGSPVLDSLPRAVPYVKVLVVLAFVVLLAGKGQPATAEPSAFQA